jgi:hypothetical protein
MSRYGRQARSRGSPLHNVRDSAGREGPVWSPNADEDGAALGRSGTTASQVCSDRLANVRRQRQTLDTIALASDDELAWTPVEVIETERADFTGAQAEPDEQQEHRVISPAFSRSPIAGRKEPLDLAGLERSR